MIFCGGLGDSATVGDFLAEMLPPHPRHALHPILPRLCSCSTGKAKGTPRVLAAGSTYLLPIRCLTKFQASCSYTSPTMAASPYQCSLPPHVVPSPGGAVCGLRERGSLAVVQSVPRHQEERFVDCGSRAAWPSCRVCRVTGRSGWWRSACLAHL